MGRVPPDTGHEPPSVPVTPDVPAESLDSLFGFADATDFGQPAPTAPRSSASLPENS